ncbi:sugar ABC transporter ATP-binding protein [Halogeometricum pallidum JCM 14848]|uniref:Sugar ABC transporter ATP-binding protein n=1 Tax=Halogeometricum pallidum JCM 14848 TaxID=1227487 RepID=M0D2V7_HALPD|nr:TOBE domain-containing protein [Halogeometricum pallidum]ELZ28479.1 sugar ABC transporter ATP-binding protein [Halogeometricum pallidum JCM 14848]
MGDDAVLGVRPEDVGVRPRGRAGDDPVHELEMVVTVVEPMGNENVVHLSFPDDRSTDALVAVTKGRSVVDEEDTVAVS